MNKDSNDIDCSPLVGDSDEGQNATWNNWKDDWASNAMGSNVGALGKTQRRKERGER